MSSSLFRAGVGCKYLGLWLLLTTGILIYGETAPLVIEPDFTLAGVFFLSGGAAFYVGCVWCKKAVRDNPPR